MTERSAVGAVLRAEQAYGLQICEKETLDYGIAYYSERFVKLPEGCQFREVLIEDAATIGSAFDQAEQWFAERGMTCLRWVPADGMPTAELTDFLTERGFQKTEFIAMVLTGWPKLVAPADVRVLPARAMRAAFRRAVADSLPPDWQGPTELLSEACEERLDDAPFDAFVAMIENEPAGWSALHQVGDIGRLTPIAVSRAYKERRVETALLAHGLALAKRLMLQMVCATVAESDTDEISSLERAGFVPDGRFMQYDRAADDRDAAPS